MFEINSPIKQAVVKWQQNNRPGQLNSNFMPVGFGQTSSGAGVNSQTPVTGTPAPKPLATAGSPTYQPPIQARDPQGKTLPQYRMGIGHRILGTLVNFANGFAGNHAQPIYVGPGALNNRYYQEEAQRQRQNQENLDWWRTQHLDAKDPNVNQTRPAD